MRARKFSINLSAILIAAAAAAESPPEMSRIPDSVYRPLYTASDADSKGAGESKIAVPSFYLDSRAVTNGDYLEFVRANPKWRKSAAKAIFADVNYLSHWPEDLIFGGGELSPVVNVSWFSARAYCRAKDKTLPTVAQWEVAAAASESSPDAGGDPEFLARVLEWQTHPPDSEFKNHFGVYGMHGQIWEWTLDFNSALATGESRADSGINRQLFCAGSSIGAAQFDDYAAFLRYALRGGLHGNYTSGSLGFRCARNIKEI